MPADFSIRKTARLILCSLAGFGCAPRPSIPPPYLRDLIKPLDKHIGSAVGARMLESDKNYRKILAQQCDVVTPENDMKFSRIHPRPGASLESYDFAAADAVVSFARRHGMLVRGHTLVWHESLPEWVAQGTFSPDELADILRRHIQTVAGRYQGQVYSWDVVNEAVEQDGTPRRTPWSRIGPDYIADAFRWARAADPGVKLFYNDYDAEYFPAKADAIFTLARSLKAAGVPIDGVGLQMHMKAGRPHGDIGALIRRFASLGLEVHITEMDVAVATRPASTQGQEQAELYGDVLQECIASPSCKAFVMWGISDRHAWKPEGTPLVLDAQFRPKPAYGALLRVLTEASTNGASRDRRTVP